MASIFLLGFLDLFLLTHVSSWGPCRQKVWAEMAPVWFRPYVAHFPIYIRPVLGHRGNCWNSTVWYSLQVGKRTREPSFITSYELMWYFGAHSFRLTEQMHECERVDLLWVLCSWGHSVPGLHGKDVRYKSDPRLLTIKENLYSKKSAISLYKLCSQAWRAIVSLILLRVLISSWGALLPVLNLRRFFCLTSDTSLLTQT